MRGRLLALLAPLVAVVVLSACEPTPEEMDSRRAELKAEINDRRSAHGIQTLFTDIYAKKKADDLATWMAATHTLTHSNPGEGYPAGWVCWAGEIIAAFPRTGDVRQDSIDVVRAWENSPEHHDIMLYPPATHGGFGVAVSDDNRLWYAVEVVVRCNP